MIYNLYLASVTGRSSVASNVTWTINWDDLFKLNNLKPENKTCRVKYEINSTTLQSTTSAYDYKTRNGYISSNFVTNNQGTSQNASLVGGCLLGTLSPEPIIAWYNGTATSNNYISYRNSTLATKGIEILTPSGVGDLNIQFYCYGASGTPVLMDYDQSYTLFLQFEFNEDD